MTSLADVLIVVAVVALVLTRQMRARRIGSDRKLWLLPLILTAIALGDHRLLDPGHRTAAALLLAAGVLLEAVMGCVWGWTTRVWREADGTVWAKGTTASLAAWAGMVVLRIGLYVLAGAFGVHQGSADLLPALAALLLVRNLVVIWRARGLEPVPAHRSMASSSW